MYFEDKMQVVFLEHSGFIVQIGRTAFLFDYYRDPAKGMERVLLDVDIIYVFSSHAHHDHFNPEILRFEEAVNCYILGFDIKGNSAVRDFPLEKVRFLAPLDELTLGGLHVKAYGSTDEGVSFSVAYGDWRMFHAGDLNWWHWKGDTKENNQFAKNGFFKQLKRLTGEKFDLAFFPVDSRLEEYSDVGAKEFCRNVEVEHFIAMHTMGVKWEAPAGFFPVGKESNVWCPIKAGSIIEINKRK